MTVWGGKQWTGPGGGVSGRLPTLGHATLHPVRARAAGCRAGGCVAPSASGAAPAALGAGALDLPLVEVVILPRGRYERSSGGRLVLGLGLGLGLRRARLDGVVSAAATMSRVSSVLRSQSRK